MRADAPLYCVLRCVSCLQCNARVGAEALPVVDVKGSVAVILYPPPPFDIRYCCSNCVWWVLVEGENRCNEAWHIQNVLRCFFL